MESIKLKGKNDEYDLKDGICAISIFLYIFILTYLFFLFIYKSNLNRIMMESFNNEYLYKFIIKTIIAILQVFPIFVIIYSRMQSLISIGIHKYDLLKSIYIGILFSIPLILIKIPGVQINNFTVSIYILNIIEQLILTALFEELIFRGFIQSRIRGIIKNKLFSIILVGIMFGVVHIPSIIVSNKGNFINLIIPICISILWRMCMHIYFNYAYTKNNSLVSSTIPHAINNILSIMF